MTGRESARMIGANDREDIPRHQPARGFAHGGEKTVDGAGLVRKPALQALAKPRFRGGDGEIEAGEMENVEVVGQRVILRASIGQKVQHRTGVRGQVMHAGSEVIAALSGKFVRHPAERVMPFEDQNALLAELGEQAGGRQPADSRADYDNIETFIRHCRGCLRRRGLGRGPHCLHSPSVNWPSIRMKAMRQFFPDRFAQAWFVPRWMTMSPARIVVSPRSTTNVISPSSTIP